MRTCARRPRRPAAAPSAGGGSAWLMARRSAQVIWGRAVRWRRSRTAPLKGRGQRRRDDDDDDDDDSDGGDGRRRGNRAAGRGDSDDLRQCNGGVKGGQRGGTCGDVSQRRRRHAAAAPSAAAASIGSPLPPPPLARALTYVAVIAIRGGTRTSRLLRLLLRPLGADGRRVGQASEWPSYRATRLTTTRRRVAREDAAGGRPRAKRRGRARVNIGDQSSPPAALQRALSRSGRARAVAARRRRRATAWASGRRVGRGTGASTPVRAREHTAGEGRHRVVIRTSRERNARAAVAHCSVSSGKGAAGQSSCRCHRCCRRRRRRPPLRRRSESRASRRIRSEHRDSSPCAPLPDTTPPERHCRARVMAPPAARRPRAAAARRFAATRRWRPALPMPPPMRQRRRRRRRRRWRRRLRRRRCCARSSAPRSRRRAPTRRCHSIRARAAGRGASQRLRLWLSRRTRPGEVGDGGAPGPYTRPI